MNVYCPMCDREIDRNDMPFDCNDCGETIEYVQRKLPKEVLHQQRYESLKKLADQGFITNADIMHLLNQ